MAAAIKFKYLCNQTEVTSKIRHAVTTYVCTSYGSKIIFFFLKKSGEGNEAEVVQCTFNLSSAPLIYESELCQVHSLQTPQLDLYHSES